MNHSLPCRSLLVIALAVLTLGAHAVAAPRPQSPSASNSSWTGTWRGTGTEQLDFGQSIQFPVVVRFDAAGSGFTADVEAQAELPGEFGQKIAVEYRGRFSGSAPTGGNIRLRGTRVTLTVKATGESIELEGQELRGTLNGTTLNGSVGNDDEGWTQLSLKRDAAAPTPSPTPTPTPTPLPSPVGTSTLKVGLDPMVAGMPGAATMKAPSSLRPGTRLTFWLGTADVMGNPGQSTIKEDPNGKWVGKDGKRYSEDTIATGGAAAGFIHIDIVAVTDQAVAMVSTQYLGDGTISAPTPSNTMSTVCHPSGCEYWIHPELLARVQPGEFGGVRYLRGPFEVNGQSYDALMIQVISANASSHNVYDMKTGFSLSMGSRMQSTKSQPSFDPVTGRATPGKTTNTTLVVSQLRAARVIDRPWLRHGLAPVSVGQTFRFRGQQTLDMGMGYPSSMPIEMTLTASHVDGSIIAYDAVTQFTGAGGTPFRSKRYCTAGQLGNVVMPPQALAELRSGQELDRDPVTGYTTFVEFVGRNEMGQNLVVIRESGQAGLQRWVYDAQTGHLLEGVVHYSNGDPSSTTTITLQRVQ